MRIARLFTIALTLLAVAAATAAAPAPVPAQAGAWQALGEYRITGYCPCVICCGKSDGITADGTYAPGFTGRLVSAPKEIPFGTVLWIDGVGAVAVHDRGGLSSFLLNPPASPVRLHTVAPYNAWATISITIST